MDDEKGLAYWGERERAPSCGLDGLAVTIDIILYIYIYIISGAYEGRSVQLRTIAWNGI